MFGLGAGVEGGVDRTLGGHGCRPGGLVPLSYCRPIAPVRRSLLTPWPGSGSTVVRQPLKKTGSCGSRRGGSWRGASPAGSSVL
jgi:hypothetical protein